MRSQSKSILYAFALLPLLSWGFGPTSSGLPRVADARLDSALARTERGMIKRNIDPYPDGLVHRPNSEEPGDAVSEGQAYGMIVSLYADDQATFDRIWDAAENSMWSASAKLYNWRVGAKGGLIGTGMATDADQDIALMLLFADSLAAKGKWGAHKSPKGATYRQRAMDILGNIWNTAVADGRYLAPGANWGGKAFVNPGYFSPASYRIFAKADPAHDWKAVIDQCYATILASPGAGRGLLPDWMVPDGSYFDGSLGYNAFRKGRAMYKDAIRVHWRLALDWLWFGEPRAKRWLDTAAAFIRTPDRADFYQMDGTLLPVSDTFSLGNGEKRLRREHSELTVGMWACAPLAAWGPERARPWADTLLAFLPAGADQWGLPADASRPERSGSTPNEGYFEQFLAWFGAAVLAGRFSNVWDDLDDPLPGVPLAWATPPAIGPDDLDFDAGPLRVTGKLNKPGQWKVRIAQNAGPAERVISGRSAEVTVEWNGADASGKNFPQGWCWVGVQAASLPDQGKWVWLAHHRDFRVDGSWLQVDDFSAPELRPNLGSWGSFGNGQQGGTAKVGSLSPSGSAGERALTWSFDLGTGGYQFCGLEWRRDGWAGFAAADRISYRARAAQRTVVDFHLVQSDIKDDNYFGVFDTLGSEWKTFTHRFAEFKGRLSGRSGAPDQAKGESLRWHIQYDRNAPVTSGSVTVDDVRIGGDLAAMYAAPAPAQARTGSPPQNSVRPGGERNRRMRLNRVGRGWELRAEPFARVRWLSPAGRVLGKSRTDGEGVALWETSGSFTNLILVEVEGRTRTLALAP